MRYWIPAFAGMMKTPGLLEYFKGLNPVGHYGTRLSRLPCTGIELHDWFNKNYMDPDLHSVVQSEK